MENQDMFLSTQEQMEELGITYKPYGTRITIARNHDWADEASTITWCCQLADSLGDVPHQFTVKAWGNHSVLITGPLLDAIRGAVSNLRGWYTPTLVRELHVELIPRLRPGETYVEVTEMPERSSTAASSTSAPSSATPALPTPGPVPEAGRSSDSAAASTATRSSASSGAVGAAEPSEQPGGSL